MMPLRLLVPILWLAVAAVTIWAIVRLGLPAAAATFFGDFAHPWRAQFYADLEAQLLLFAAWVLFRERSRPRAIAFAALTILLGALFTLAYVLAASLRGRGDVAVLLLGPERAARRGQSS